MAQRQTVADFGLVRRLQADYAPVPGLYNFLTPFIGATTSEDWTHHCIADSRTNYNFIAYAICVPKGAMIVFRAFLTQELPAAYTVHLAPEDRPAPTRVTDMRLWQMIVDSWTAAGGRPEALRHLAFHHIVNDAANAAISRAFDRRDAQPGQTVVITPDDGDMWATNPFARCGSAVARALRAATPGQRAVPVRAHLQCPAARDERAQVHMVVEFGSDEPASSPAPQPVEAVEEDVGNEPGFDLLSLAGPAQATAGPMGEPEDEQGFDLLSLKVRVRPQRGADMTTSSRESAGKNKRSREPGPDESRSRKRLNDGLNLKVHFDFDLRVW